MIFCKWNFTKYHTKPIFRKSAKINYTWYLVYSFFKNPTRGGQLLSTRLLFWKSTTEAEQFLPSAWHYLTQVVSPASGWLHGTHDPRRTETPGVTGAGDRAAVTGRISGRSRSPRNQHHGSVLILLFIHHHYSIRSRGKCSVSQLLIDLQVGENDWIGDDRK